MELSKKQKKNLLRIVFAAVLLLLLGVASWRGLMPKAFYLRLSLFLIPYFLVGWDVLWRAVRGICNGQLLDENFLMSLATVGAFVLGEYAEAVFVMLFYQVGELFQSIAVGKSRRSIAALMDIRPDTARVLRDGAEVVVDPDEVTIGETLVIRPGEKIALDGVVLDGKSELNTLSLTGEAMPRDVSVGDEVLSGCVNVSGVLQVRVTRVYGESTVSRILELVESSALVKSKAENAVTRFAHWYTPLVVAGAVLLALIPSLLTGEWQRWLETALIFLVVSCPCALVISVPLSYFGGLGAASRHGVLIKGGNYLEMLASVDTVVFDKTGTLTEGGFCVSYIDPAEGVSQKELLLACCAAESQSNHPIARSLRDACRDEGLVAPKCDAVRELSGFGVCATVGQRRILVGNAALMRREGIAFTVSEKNGTVAYVAEDARFLGSVTISDRIKPNAKAAIDALRANGISLTVMLTGDREANAREVAKELGLDDYSAELLPEDKVCWVETLQKETTGVLAFVGDGVNDAPVLARADVGIAMGALGSDAAIEAADVVLMDDSPERIAQAVSIAVFTKRIVWQNILFALVVKGLFLLLSILGWTNMWAATFADVGVAVIAILNAMRTLRYRSTK